MVFTGKQYKSRKTEKCGSSRVRQFGRELGIEKNVWNKMYLISNKYISHFFIDKLWRSKKCMNTYNLFMLFYVWKDVPKLAVELTFRYRLCLNCKTGLNRSNHIKRSDIKSSELNRVSIHSNYVLSIFSSSVVRSKNYPGWTGGELSNQNFDYLE